VDFYHIRDPVHSHIKIPDEGLVSKLIDTPELQRLRYIRQLGVTYQTFPGGEHSRFFHSLGVAHMAGRMFDAVTGPAGNTGEREKLQVASLLHDVGHSPFSHVLERFFTPGVSHEEWGQRIIQDGSTAVGEVLAKSPYSPREIAALIGKEPSRPRYLHLIVSSQMDADRFDYLRRDAYYTGAPYGNYDLERILLTITIGKNDAVQVIEKGKFSVEGYLFSRYHMYNQIYLHKTTLCFEFLLRAMLKRAVELLERSGASLPKVLMFGDTPMGTNMNIQPVDYLSVTDNEVLACVRSWTRSQDPVLSDLSRRFLWRRPIFKPVKNPAIDQQSIYDKKEKMAKILQSRGLDPTYYLYVSMREARDAYRPYSPQKEDRENAILLEDGREISEALPGLRALDIGPTMLLCVPEELREEIARVLK